MRRLRGELPIHSRYCGYPRLMKLCLCLSEITVKRFVEPLLVFLGGVFTLQVNQPLGFYWMIGAACMCGQASQAEAWERMQATNMHDAVLDQQEVAERFRGMRGDDFNLEGKVSWERTTKRLEMGQRTRSGQWRARACGATRALSPESILLGNRSMACGARRRRGSGARPPRRRPATWTKTVERRPFGPGRPAAGSGSRGVHGEDKGMEMEK